MSSSASQSGPCPLSLPLVVQVGFAGARNLLDSETHPGIDAAAFEAAILPQLSAFLQELPDQLGLSTLHFLCGVSQIAVGGDTLFTRACQAAAIPQRIFLTQTTDEYLQAVGSKGPDFTDAQRLIAIQLLAGEHIIQQRVVSDAPTREERFQDANYEIVRVSDVVIVLVREGQIGKPGGSHEMLDLAAKRNMPALELFVSIHDGQPQLTSRWHRRESFHTPGLPKVLSDSLPANEVSHLTHIGPFGDALKRLGSSQARWLRKLFTSAAAVIIGTHILATIIAVVALKLHHNAIAWALGGELLLLAFGFLTHHYLHRSHAVQRWALSRLVAETVRSVSAIGRFHLYLDYLFALPFPAELRTILRTLNVLHLKATSRTSTEAWQTKRDAYVERRLVSPPNAQIPYNQRTRDDAQSALKRAQRIFLAASLLAFAATATKLLLLCHILHLSEPSSELIAAIMGGLAIVLPTVAVAALSLASALDLEARYHISDEMVHFLESQRKLLESASTSREFARLVLETESRLLGETVNWYARRTFLGIA